MERFEKIGSEKTRNRDLETACIVIVCMGRRGRVVMLKKRDGGGGGEKGRKKGGVV